MSLLTDDKPSRRRGGPKRSGRLSFIPVTKLMAPHIPYIVGFIHEQDCPALGLSTLDWAFVLAAPVTFKPASRGWCTRIFAFRYLYHSSGQWWPWSPWKWCVQHIPLDQRGEDRWASQMEAMEMKILTQVGPGVVVTTGTATAWRNII